jgi:hypothetical protein
MFTADGRGAGAAFRFGPGGFSDVALKADGTKLVSAWTEVRTIPTPDGGSANLYDDYVRTYAVQPGGRSAPVFRTGPTLLAAGMTSAATALDVGRDGSFVVAWLEQQDVLQSGVSHETLTAVRAQGFAPDDSRAGDALTLATARDYVYMGDDGVVHTEDASVLLGGINVAAVGPSSAITGTDYVVCYFRRTFDQADDAYRTTFWGQTLILAP